MGHHHARGRRLARAFGLRLIGWSIDTHDWHGDEPRAMLAAARPALPAGGSVLMHDAVVLEERPPLTSLDGVQFAARRGV